MKIKVLTSFAAMILIAAVGVKGQETKTEEQIITFEAEASNFTIPVSINPKGEITGDYVDASSEAHGFIRDKEGKIIAFDAPGARATYGTFPSGINPNGEIAGSYGSNGVHGFLRDKEGKFTTFDFPDAVAFEGTFVSGINPSGDVIGFTGFLVAKCCGQNLSFVRHKDGSFITFGVPDASGTQAESVNPSGEITGIYYDEGTFPGTIGGEHSFLRHEDGTITTFDVPESGGPYATDATGINASDEITGYYYYALNPFIDGVHGFLRHRDGKITTFDVPGAAKTNFEGTFAMKINASGEITGYYYDANNVVHGFVRDRDGKFTTFDPRGSVGTYPTSINPSGEITGYYLDAKGRNHGFLRKSDHHEKWDDEKDDEDRGDSERPE